MNTPHTQKSIRVTVPVSPEVLALFQRFSKLSGQSVGKSMASWLQETKDGIEPMMDILEHHKKAPMKAIQSLQNYAVTLNDATGDLFSKVANMDSGGAELAAAADGARLAAKTLEKARKGVLTPPSSNTGGKGRKTTKKAAGGSK